MKSKKKTFKATKEKSGGSYRIAKGIFFGWYYIVDKSFFLTVPALWLNATELRELADFIEELQKLNS